MPYLADALPFMVIFWSMFWRQRGPPAYHITCHIWHEALYNNSSQLEYMNLDVTCDVTVFVNRPLLIWLQYFILYSCLSQVNLVVISRFTVLGPSVIKGNNNFEILLIKTFSLKQKSNQILPASTEKIKFCLVKKTASCSFRL